MDLLLSLLFCLLASKCCLPLFLRSFLSFDVRIELRLSLLCGDALKGKLLPDSIEFSLVHRDELRTLYCREVLLVAIDGLSGPVERTCQEHLLVNDDELVVHVVPNVVVHGDRDAFNG